MTAVVIYSSQVGCVCEVKGSPAAGATVSAAGVAAAGAVINQEQETQRRNASQR